MANRRVWQLGLGVGLRQLLFGSGHLRLSETLGLQEKIVHSVSHNDYKSYYFNTNPIF